MFDQRKIDFSSIEVQVRRARLERSLALGEFIADSIVTVWAALKRTGQYLRVQAEQLARTPDSYSTSLRRP